MEDVKVDIPNELGCTPLHFTVMYFSSGDSTRTLRSLLFKGADSEIKNKEDKTAFDLAEECVDSESMEKL
jgi:ankyrin repeat protein